MLHEKEINKLISEWNETKMILSQKKEKDVTNNNLK